MSPDFVRFPADTPPLLMVIVDTEEEFDWSQPHSRDNTSVKAIAEQHRAQEIFVRYGVVPTYVVDYPVATTAQSIEVIGDFLTRQHCEIGAHLHPWVNPPHEESVNARNSYPGNLPAELERAKLECLTAVIAANLGVRPTVYKAGRYGIGGATAEHLEDLGYEVDVSVVPYTSFADDGGPDFRGFGFRPYWFGDRRRLLEIPLSCGFAGALTGWAPRIFPALSGPLGIKLHAPGIAARLGLVERIRLTPEGIEPAAHRRLTESLLRQGCRVFSLTYHSSSLRPRGTPYVRTTAELESLLRALDRYLAYFLNDLGGRATTPRTLYHMLRAHSGADRQTNDVE